MIPSEIGYGIVAGLLSFLTPETLLLLPLMLAAAGASSRIALAMGPMGIGVALAFGGMAATWLGATFGLDAVWLRRLDAGVLVLLGLVLLAEAPTRRLAILTGGSGGYREGPAPGWFGNMARLFLLALLLGVNWLPRFTPLLGKATLAAAAETPVYNLALEVMFAFGVGAALPWTLLGGIVGGLMGRSSAADRTGGMAGKRLLALALLAVAGLGLSGADAGLMQALNGLLPLGVRRLAMTY